VTTFEAVVAIILFIILIVFESTIKKKKYLKYFLIFSFPLTILLYNVIRSYQITLTAKRIVDIETDFFFNLYGAYFMVSAYLLSRAEKKTESDADNLVKQLLVFAGIFFFGSFMIAILINERGTHGIVAGILVCLTALIAYIFSKLYE